MHRAFSVVRVLLALFVAVLLPLEQARCACRMAENPQSPGMHACCMKRAAEVAPPKTHACCAARAAHAKPSQSAHHCGGACTCYSAPAESAPVATLAPANEAPTLSPLAAIAMCAVLTAPAPTVTVAAPPPDIGGPPLPEAALAHSLRGPPAIR